MENKINIAELLKDCPKGMELDCILFNNPVKYGGIEDDDGYPITILSENDDYFYVTKEGYLYNTPNSKCVIFPKGKTTWEGFVPPCKFKDGDILYVDCTKECYDEQHDYIFILKEIGNREVDFHCCYYIPRSEFKVKESQALYFTGDKYPTRFATEEEKQKLFDAIKENGYKWNAETKALEELTKFKSR